MHTVLFVESGGSGGGSFLSLKLLLESLDRKRFRPVVAFLNQTRFLEEYWAMGVDARLVFDPVYTATVPWWLRKRLERISKRCHEWTPALAGGLVRLVHAPVLGALERIVREEGASLLYSNNHLNRNIFMAALARRTGLPLVCHLRSRGNEHFVPARRDYVLGAVSQFLCINSKIREHWVHSGIPEERIEIVPNCLPDIHPDPLDLNRAFGVSPGDRTIGIVARMTWEKGHSLLLDAFALLLRGEPGVTLLMVGDGPKEQELREKAEALGVAQKVLFCGYQDRPHDIIAALDVLAQPSKTDPASRSVQEAMQLGVPAVVTKVGAIFEIMRDGETGYMVDEGDPQALAKALSQALQPGEKRDGIRRRAKAFVDEYFNQGRTTGRVEALMSRVLRESKSA